MVETADRENAPKGTVYSESHSKSNVVVDLSDDNELSKTVEGLHGNARYTVIRDYILTSLEEQPVTLSDGKKAIIDRSDAKHIASNSGRKKKMQIFKIKKFIKNPLLVAEDPSKKVGKFEHFYYYEVAVKYEDEIYPIYLNVGKARNDSTYHLYDITQKNKRYRPSSKRCWAARG